MKEKPFVSVICEYNPFHYGHKYQIERLKDEFSAVVCIMSGNIVQRGSVAVADKYLRAEAALKSGADLVLELPIPWCCSSARDFAMAGVHIAASLGSPYLAFGTEDDINELVKLESFISSNEFSERIKELSDKNKNISYPVLMKTVVKEAFDGVYGEMLEKPNNILGLEYLSAMKDKDILPFAVKRNFGFRSSSSIRELNDGRSILAALPSESACVFSRELNRDFPRSIERLDSFYLGSLRRMDGSAIPEDLYSTPADLAQKLISRSHKCISTSQLVNACADKVYTYARVRRGLNSLLFGITTERVAEKPPYTCVLASNEKGREILRSAKSSKDIDIITKPVRAMQAGDRTKEAFAFAKSVEDVIALSAPEPIPSDTGKTPYITGE